ncbi:MAG: hypothetical protein QN194_14555 [Armatimonadota bacterium]|nr:hypothetical protein [Armatimonadota bacterium]MDR7574130.1 hypothetical protein [Armatimonadota bacterium]
MRSILVVLILLAVVSGTAVKGLLAAPLPKTSVAAAACAGPRVLDSRCRPAIQVAAAELERELAGDYARDFSANEAGWDYSAPDWHWKDLLVALFVAAANWFMEHFSGDVSPANTAYLLDTAFDVE